MSAIELINLVKQYSPDHVAVNGLSLTVNQGTFFGLLGPNGAGKSTTIGMISSLITPTSGQIKIGGIGLSEHPARAKQQMGVVPQEFNAMVFETCETILRTHAGYYGVPTAVARDRMAVLLDQLELTGLERVPAFQLSGGMKRRLMLARALIHRPPILILDEPTAGVDIQLRRVIWQLLQTLNQEGVTILLTTHYIEEAEALCRQVGVIQGGQLIANEPTRDLIAKLSKETVILEISAPHGCSMVGLEFNYRWVDSGDLEVDLPKGTSLTQLIHHLSDHQIVVHRATPKSNRLEEAFMRLIA